MIGHVFVSRSIPQPGLDLLQAHCQVDVFPNSLQPTEAQLIEGVRDKDALLSLLSDQISAEVMDAAPNLKVISNYAVGFNNIDIDAANERGIVVTNTPGVLTEATADFTWALLMAVARRLVEADHYTRSGQFQGWGPLLFLGHDIFEKTIGIVGLGRIGQAVARRARGFNMNVLYHSRTIKDKATESELNATYVPLDELLQQSDFVVLTTPLTPETTHLIGIDQLNLMKSTAILINTARGPVVDEQALVDALRDKHIAGAGLDVFENEPALTPGLTDLDNVVLAPHIASATVDTRERMATMAAQSVIDVLKGERPRHMVNPEVWNVN